METQSFQHMKVGWVENTDPQYTDYPTYPHSTYYLTDYSADQPIEYP